MNESNSTKGEQWLEAQQVMWKAFFPGAPTGTETTLPAHEATPLEQQFNDLRDTRQASVSR